MDPIIARNISIFVTTIIIASIVGLGFVLRNGTNSSTQALDLVTIAQGLQKSYQNTSFQYGTGTISPAVLINSGKVDPNTVANGNIQTRWQTIITLTGTGSGFSATLPGIPSNNCVDLMLDQTLEQYVTSIGAGTVRAEPVAQATAAADCGTSGTVTMTVNFIGHP